MALTHQQARRVYDRIGKWQDSQARYEDRAIDELIAHAAFDKASSIAELGCGTGRLALRLLKEQLGPTATYLGMDVSQTMIELAEARLRPYRERVTLVHTDGTIHFPLPAHSVDRLISTYVFDLLSAEDIAAVLGEARRLLTADGKLCLVSLTESDRPVSRLVCTIWNTLYRLHAPLVGGCHPIRLDALFDQRKWSINYRTVVIQLGIPSEVLIASATSADD